MNFTPRPWHGTPSGPVIEDITEIIIDEMMRIQARIHWTLIEWRYFESLKDTRVQYNRWPIDMYGAENCSLAYDAGQMKAII